MNGSTSSSNQRNARVRSAASAFNKNPIPHDESRNGSARNTSADPSKYSKRRKHRHLLFLRLQTLLSYVAVILCAATVFVFVRNNFVSNDSDSDNNPSSFSRLRRAKESLLFHHKQRQELSLPHQDGGDETPKARNRRLELAFDKVRQAPTIASDGTTTTTTTITTSISSILQTWLAALDSDMVHNVKGGIRWIRPYLLPPLHKSAEQDDTQLLLGQDLRQQLKRPMQSLDSYFRIKRKQQKMKWEEEWEQIQQQQQQQQQNTQGPKVDYTDDNLYSYPTIPSTTAPLLDSQQYPPLKSLAQLMESWPQDEDAVGSTIHEGLYRFNFSNPDELAMAKILRDHELPFKLYDVPELTAASMKWTDDYLSFGFGLRQRTGLLGGVRGGGGGSPPAWDSSMPAASGTAQESPNNYFAFFVPKLWNTDRMGLPPTRNNDWSYAHWAQHARYADATSLSFEQPHFYWQAGVDREERHQPPSRWTFISRDLPSFSTKEENFFVFHPEEQKGIQCRFGERGVVAATHYDGGRNFIAMITGAKRYILSPPTQCSKLGVFTSRKSPIYRHSLLNFAHIRHLKNDNNGMSKEERAWLEKAGQALSVETVLKAGEALYIPSHWFHYIVSLQKSAQCNVRSGIDRDGHPVFGNRETVEQCVDV